MHFRVSRAIIVGENHTRNFKHPFDRVNLNRLARSNAQCF